MAQTAVLPRLDIKPLSKHFYALDLIIPSHFVDTIYKKAAHAFQEKTSTLGFSKGQTPLEYIEEHYRANLLKHVEEFLFNFIGINILYQELHAKKLVVCGEPRLINVMIEPHHEACFHFESGIAEPIDFREWKHFAFKAPKRKNYKDIDRQVDSFIAQETENFAKHSPAITVGDWICFNLELLDAQGIPTFAQHRDTLWLKIGNEEADQPFQTMFSYKKLGDSFINTNDAFQEYFNHNIPNSYPFNITIQLISPYDHFSFEDFKQHFRLKTNKDVHKKLIEIFSYRNDFSLRRSIIEEALKLLLSKHHVEIPDYVILRQEKAVLEHVQNNPDYQVYKTQKDFKDTVRQLAIKQSKEIILIDQLAYKENIKVTNCDVKHYLNLMKRPRTKEFIYFLPPETKIEGKEMPLPAEILKKHCLREKTLNHIIYHLIKK